MSSVMLPARWICHLARQQDRTQRNPLENTFPKDSTFLLLWFFLTVNLSYVASTYVIYLCSIFFQGIHNENDPNKGSGAVRTLWSGTSSCIPDYKIRTHLVTFWPVTFHQRLGRLVEFECIFWWFWMWNTFYMTVIKTYDLFKAIKRLGSSTFSFILLHLLSYIFFNSF